MGGVDGGGNLWAVAMLGLDCVGQTSIRGAELKFERVASNCELLFRYLQPSLLCRIELQLMMKQLVHLRGRRPHGHQHPTGKDAR